ncbi:MAG: hypothetical protein IT236_18305 [Bacteroidia bacterium]|nr:hypothetical protein [Bacteroidia bacterium]
MEGITLIEGETLKHWEQRLLNIEQNQLAILKKIDQLNPSSNLNSVPDFISVENAAKKYNVSKQTIYNKINLFYKYKGRTIDRLQMGSSNLVNEIELLEAIRFKTPVPLIFTKNKSKK